MQLVYALVFISTRKQINKFIEAQDHKTDKEK